MQHVDIEPVSGQDKSALGPNGLHEGSYSATFQQDPQGVCRTAQHRKAVALSLAALVGGAFGVSLWQLSLRTRGKTNVSDARQIAMYLAHVTCGLSLTDVGELFGRDRTTVAHACRVVEGRRDAFDFDVSLNALESVAASRLESCPVALPTVTDPDPALDPDLGQGQRFSKAFRPVAQSSSQPEARP